MEYYYQQETTSTVICCEHCWRIIRPGWSWYVLDGVTLCPLCYLKIMKDYHRLNNDNLTTSSHTIIKGDHDG